VTFEWDPSSPKAPTALQIASSGKSSCTRCLGAIAQGSLRVGYKDRCSTGSFSGSIMRFQHAECFGKWPFRGIASLQDVNFVGSVRLGKREQEFPLSRSPAEAHRKLKECWQPVPQMQRVTSLALEGARQREEYGLY